MPKAVQGMVLCILTPLFLSMSLQIVITLEIYGVKNIVGIPFGYRGFSDSSLAEMPVSISIEFVRVIIY